MSKIHLRVDFTGKNQLKCIGMALLNMAKTRTLYPVYNLKIFKFSTILSADQPASQPTCLPAIKPGSTSAMAPDFSHKKGNCV